MKRILLVILLVISMLAVVGFTSVGASYWEEMKEIYKWNAMEGKSEAEINLSVPDMDIDYQFKINVNSQSSFDDFSSYSEIKIEDLQGKIDIPVIKMYTYGSDIYINKEAVLPLLAVAGLADDIEINEEFIMLESDKDNVEIDFNNMLNDVIEFINEMDLGVDLNMEKKGDTYTLTLESDELIDLIDAYMRYIIENIDQFPNSLMQGQEIVITEEEKQEALEEYNAFIGQYKDMAKTFAKGSKIYMEATFGEDKYNENSQLYIKIMGMGELSMNTVSTTSRLEKSSFELPTSVMKITAEELGELITDRIGVETNVGLKAVIKLDGTYIKFVQFGLEEGQIPLEIINGQTYIAVEDAEKLLDVKLEGIEDPFHIRKLSDYGFSVDWNGEDRAIEIWQ